MSKVGASLASTIRSDVGKSFGKAQDRFAMPTHTRQSPPPGSYSIPDTIGVDVERQKPRVLNARNMGKTVFGKEDRSRQFTKLLLPGDSHEVPGPGRYAHYTKFNNLAKERRSLLASR